MKDVSEAFEIETNLLLHILKDIVISYHIGKTYAAVLINLASRGQRALAR